MQSEQQQRIMGYFIEEAKDHLNTIEQGLLNLQNTIEDPEMVSEVFRAAHSVKGGAAMLGLGSIQQTAHRLEDYFKVLKECPIRIDQKLESLFLRVFDTLQELLEQLQGPFGLTDDKANEVMSEVEPVFGSLNEHLTQLVSQSGGTPPEDVELMPVSGFPITSPPIPVTAGASSQSAASQEESALQLIFKSDVPARLREMLQLFKQTDDTNSRQQLQTICQSLVRAGEQFDLPNWCELLDTASRAVANPDNTYRTLAPILIRDIKQAQEFVLAGNAFEICASEGLRSLLPPEPEEMVMDDDFANLLAEIDFEEDSSIPEFIEFNLEPEEQPLTAASAAIDESTGSDDWFSITTAIQMDDDDSSDLGFGLDEIDLDAGQPSDLSLDLGHDFSSADIGPVIDQHGPEVGIAELNSLADLFEGEVPDLGMTWQEEEIISDSASDLSSVAELNSSGDFSDSDFSDLLFDEDGLEELDLEEHHQDDDLSDLLNVSEISYTNSSASLEHATEAADSSEPLSDDLLSDWTNVDWNIDASDNLASDVESFDPSNDLASGFDSFGSSDDLASEVELSLGTDAGSTDADANRGLDNLSELFAGLDDGALDGNLDADELNPTATSDESVFDTPGLSDINPDTNITSAELGDNLDFSGSEVESLADNPFEIEDFFGNDVADLAVDFQSDLDNPFTLSESEQDDLDSTGLEVLQDFSDDDALISAFSQDADSDNLEEFGGVASSESASGVDPWAALDAEEDVFLTPSNPSVEPPAPEDDVTTDLWADSSEGFVAAPSVIGTQPEAIAPIEEDFFDQLPDPFAEEEPLPQANDFQFIDFDAGSGSNGLAIETVDADLNEISETGFGDSALDNADVDFGDLGLPTEAGFGDIVLEESLGEDFSLGDEDDTDALLDDAISGSELDQAFEADFPQDMSLFEAESLDEASPDFLSFSDSLSFESELPDVTDTSDAPIEAIEMDLAALLDEVTEEDAQDETVAPDALVSAGVAVEDETYLSNLFDEGDSADLTDLSAIEGGIDVLSIDSVSPEIAYAPETSQDNSEVFALPNVDDDLFGVNEFGLTLDDNSLTSSDTSIPDAELDFSSADTAESLVDLDFGWDQPEDAIALSEVTPLEGVDSQISDGISDAGLGISADFGVEPSDLGDMLVDFGSEDLAAEDFGAENIDEGFGSEDFNLEDFGSEDITDTASDFDNSLDSIDFGNLSLDLDDVFAASEESESTDDLNLSLDIPESEITGTDDSADFDRLDALLTEEPELLPQPELASVEPSSADTDGFSDLDALLSGVMDDPSPVLESQPAVSEDSFADLDALLAEDVSTSASASRPSGLDDFEDLEALLGDQPKPRAATPTPPSAPSRNTGSDFDDLEKLLEDADQTLGGPPTARGARGPSLVANRNKNRPTRGVLSDQTMRVSVKNLDNLNNLVGELVVNRNSLEQAEERLRQFLDNLLYQVQQLSDVGQRMRDLYERSLLESSLLSSRKTYQMSSQSPASPANHATGVSFDALEMDRFTGFHTLSQEMIELIVRVRESASDIDFVVDETDQVTRNFRQITTQLQEGLTRSRMVPFAQTADRLPRAVRDISLKCGKQAELTIEGRETLIDKMILEQLYDPMTHLVNNAITHGIETPDERLSRGKSPTGRITVRTFHQGNQTVISVTDDGAGIDPEIVKRKAIEKGLITPVEAESMSRLDVYDLLFHHGFSTKDKADDFAGRGVGMDVVRTSLNEIRGVVNIDSTIGKGTTFTIRLPLTLSISKALCCISNRARIAFPMDGVEDMLDVPKERILRDDQDRPCIQWRDQLLPFQPLSELLKYNRSLGRGSVYGGNQEDDIVSVVVLRSNAGNFLALQVDQVLGEQEIVIKQLEGPVPKPIGVAGATVLGDGRIMPIADVLELIDLSMGRIRREAGSSLWEKDEDELPPEAPEAKTEPTVLIVDDSITVRELLSMTFNKVGYRVEQARDGQEAWEKLRSGLPCDLVFCDIEMPRMDGLELLSRIQKDPSLGHLPIAMLTSRGADRHRQMAIQLGAKGYFTKPYLEEALLDAAQRMLKGEVLVNSGS